MVSYIVGINLMAGFLIGSLIVKKHLSLEFKDEKLKAIIHILNFESLSEERRDFYANRSLTLAGFSFTSLALYLSWNDSITNTTSILAQRFFVATLLLLISSQITIEAERFWQLWLSELVHYLGYYLYY